jgi:extradiol dioxygenase family protein
MRRAIDHLVLCVHDLAAAGAFYGRLGFTLTPRAEHPFGTANRLVQLRGSFLELVTVADPRRIAPAGGGEFSFGAFTAAFLRKSEGMSMLVLQTDDAVRDRQDFAKRGLETYAPFHFSRKARQPDGAEAEVSFSLAFVSNRDMPDAAFFSCQQHAPQYFWKPEYQRHANAATRVLEVLMAGAEPARFADFFGRLLGTQAVSVAKGMLRIALEGSALLVLDAAEIEKRFPGDAQEVAAEARFVGFTVTVEDLAGLETRLRAAGIPFARAGALIQVSRRAAFGAAIEFTAG